MMERKEVEEAREAIKERETETESTRERAYT